MQVCLFPLLWVWPCLSLQDANDPVQIACNTYKVKVGHLYTSSKDPTLKVWTLKEMDDKKAIMIHDPLFGQAEKLELPHADLKGYKEWTKPLPALYSSLSSSLQPTQSMEDEFFRAKAQCLLYEKYSELLGLIW